jgi:hypothetical protein
MNLYLPDEMRDCQVLSNGLSSQSRNVLFFRSEILGKRLKQRTTTPFFANTKRLTLHYLSHSLGCIRRFQYRARLSLPLPLTKKANLLKNNLTFFGGGGIKLVSEFGKSSRKGVMVFKGKQYKVVEAIDGRGLT